MKAAIVFMLLTVSSNAEVHHEYFPTSKECEDARFVAEYGMTEETMNKECNAQMKRTGSGSCMFQGANLGAEIRHAECIKEVKP